MGEDVHEPQTALSDAQSENEGGIPTPLHTTGYQYHTILVTLILVKTFMHLAHALIESDLQCVQVIPFILSVYAILRFREKRFLYPTHSAPFGLWT